MTEMGEKFDKRLTVDVIIPTYKPDRRFARLIRRLGQQTYPINKIIVVNTEKQDWKPEYCKKVKNLEVHHVSRQEFDHGRTRNFGASLSQGDIMIFMTDDAIPKTAGGAAGGGFGLEREFRTDRGRGLRKADAGERLP